MPVKARDVTVEPAGTPQQEEDRRVLPTTTGASDEESLPALLDGTHRGIRPPRRTVVVRSPSLPPLPLPIAGAAGDAEPCVVLVGDLAGSPSESVASPPFFPTSRHHSFFMDDLESHPGDGDQSPSSNAREHRHSPPASSPIAAFSGVMARAQSARNSASDTTVVVVDAQSLSATAAEAGAEGGAPRRSTSADAPAVGAAAAGPGASPGVVAVPLESEAAAVEVKETQRRRHRHRLVATAPPFDPLRPQQLNLLTMGPDPALPLYTFKEIPHWQKYNPYIRTGYRAFYSAGMCLRSMLGWHNETINVYSHFLTFVAFAVLTVLLYTTVLSKAISAPTMAASKLMYGIFCFGSMLCMLNSSVYHLYNCHSHQRIMTAMGRLDFIGITVLIVASFLPPLYVMFHCYRVLRIVYITTILILGSVAVIGPWTDIFHEHVGLRVATFLGLGFSGVVPSIHCTFLQPLTSANTSVVTGVVLMVALYCAGVVFYVTQFPESKYPGHFDFWLSSHQIWHFFVSMAALVHYFNCVSMYQLWQISDGKCN